jgi:hypothetical protein
MRLLEIESPAAENLTNLRDACESWIELWKPNDQIKIILAHPFSQRFKSSNSTKIYRAVFTSKEKFNKNGVVRLNPRNGLIPYSENPKWGGSARSDFDYAGDILRFEKSFNATDCILNFSTLVNELSRLGHKIYAPNESELWMRATPYYKTFKQNELVDIDKGV